jgi:hypothetical protein
MEVGEKSRNGKESGWGESISASRLRGKENTLPTSGQGSRNCPPVHVSQSSQGWWRSQTSFGTYASPPPVD